MRFAAIILFLPISAFAQVNVEPMRKQLKDDSNFAGIFSQSLSGKNNNAKKFNLELNSEILLGFKVEQNNYFYFNSYLEFEREFGEVEKLNAFAHVRYNYQISPSFLFGEIFLQGERDKGRKVYSRSLIGIGPRIVLEISEEVSVAYGTSYMWEWGIADIIYTNRYTHRWNNYATFAWIIVDKISIENTTYFQPTFNELSNYRFLNESSLNFNVTENITNSISALYHFETEPLSDSVTNSDSEIRNSFQFSF